MSPSKSVRPEGRQKSTTRKPLDNDDAMAFDFGSLPDEILVEVISYLDNAPPLSTTEVRRRPHEEIFTRANSPLKKLSTVSKRWRRVTLPVLFRHLYIDFDTLLLRAVGGPSDPLEYNRFFDTHHEQLILKQLKVMITELTALGVTGYAHSLLVLFRANVLYATLQKVIDQAISSFWRQILETFDLSRIVLLSPFVGLASLVSCVEGGFLKSQFGEIPVFNILVLDVKSDSLTITNDREASDYGIATKSPTDFRFRTTSLLHMRSWSHIGLNEGNIGDMLEQYEYDTSSTASLLPYLFPPCCLQQDTAHSHRWAHLRDNMTFLDSFSYTALCVPPGQIPSTRYTSGVHPLKYVRKLDIKILPDMRDALEMMNDINDPEEFEDFIQQHDEEIEIVYADLRADMIRNCNEEGWRLKTLISDDHDVYAKSRYLIEHFEDQMNYLIQDSGEIEDGTNHASWGRVWEVVDHEQDGQITKRFEIKDKLVVPESDFDDVDEDGMPDLEWLGDYDPEHDPDGHVFWNALQDHVEMEAEERMYHDMQLQRQLLVDMPVAEELIRLERLADAEDDNMEMEDSTGRWEDV
ncbi:Hypothetical protein D9617_17g047070 [Elsinoe fawcettii]|nr:Hypothetical protein D9617_17g047070 [Elsinoe fawcettii]